MCLQKTGEYQHTCAYKVLNKAFAAIHDTWFAKFQFRFCRNKIKNGGDCQNIWNALHNHGSYGEVSSFECNQENGNFWVARGAVYGTNSGTTKKVAIAVCNEAIEGYGFQDNDSALNCA
ncbi:hypothetical protein M427DRAFT_326257 [Gonapodya prolifera JEL478]|uniref:Uncharacterized protein n=1 Tax=Gonapodya prolifera (strain JEL478) TaxID=1344416 RepID=A0A139AFM1_GONPJ|nr:hypothetical protein M427DRAFT_326257 [Gonapodya prolifera JEL478]|eukprot:KXS15215.1 hypothetical protein M427DRAFT_326257 [Gonapodya prolifera JEL478]